MHCKPDRRSPIQGFNLAELLVEPLPMPALARLKGFAFGKSRLLSLVLRDIGEGGDPAAHAAVLLTPGMVGHVHVASAGDVGEFALEFNNLTAQHPLYIWTNGRHRVGSDDFFDGAPNDPLRRAVQQARAGDVDLLITQIT